MNLALILWNKIRCNKGLRIGHVWLDMNMNIVISYTIHGFIANLCFLSSLILGCQFSRPVFPFLEGGMGREVNHITMIFCYFGAKLHNFWPGSYKKIHLSAEEEKVPPSEEEAPPPQEEAEEEEAPPPEEEAPPPQLRPLE